MLELPEAHVMAAQLAETICGRVMADVIMNGSPHKFAFFVGDPAEYAGELLGKSFDGAVSYGGLVELRAGAYRMVFGDGVNLRFHASSSEAPVKHQMRIGFADGTVLTASVQMYGGLWGFREGNWENPYRDVAMRMPSPLTESFDMEWFQRLLNAERVEKLSLKAFLATEQRIPGLGNGVLQDILWTAGLHPKRKMSTLTEEETIRLHRTVRQLLAQMVAEGGRDTEKDLFGHPGRYVTRMSKLHVMEGCAACGAGIRKEAYLGGSIYYCLKCQPLS